MAPQPRTDNTVLQAYRRPVIETPTDLKLDGNEGARPSASLLHDLDSGVAAALREYPSTCEIEEDLGRRYGRSAVQLMVTAGADEALDRLCRAYLEPGRNAIVPQPCFEMITRYVALARGDFRGVEWLCAESPVTAILDAADASTRLVIIASPNNPTGSVLSVGDFGTLAQALPHALIVADLAYVEYADEDPCEALAGIRNLVCLRTLSKAWGLAGLRVGFVMGDAEVIDLLRAVGGPYSVAGLSLALARHRLDEESQMLAHVRRVQNERRVLSELAMSFGFEVWPSQANFVYLRGSRSRWLYQMLCGTGIAVRMFEDGDCVSLRLTCPGDASTFERLVTSFACAVQPTAILFDVDGVLVDVSDSYRRAIEETAAAFGVTVTQSDITARKAQGDANDDWELTRSLIVDAGVQAAIGDVRAEFERRYQGEGAAPGFWKNERLLMPRSSLAELARRVPLGIVTGRPRVDMERFLDQFDLRSLFSVCVSREDAAAMKPDPAPLRVALAELGLGSAWYLGDTVDDMRAARAAACVPIGVIAPGEDPCSTTVMLQRAGAGVVFDSVLKLEEVLAE